LQYNPTTFPFALGERIHVGGGRAIDGEGGLPDDFLVVGDEQNDPPVVAVGEVATSLEHHLMGQVPTC
jgi:hypothetical protein